MKRSETINELAAALAKAQKAFQAAERGHTAKVETKSGGSYSFNYADLAAYLDVCRAPLGDNGLSYVQEPRVDGDKVSVTTLLMHASGQWIETEPLLLTLIPDSRGALTPQIVGSGVTYARRYSLSAVTGLASEADDDGNAASGNQAETGQRAPAPQCPACNKNEAVIKGQEQYGGGWVCWKRKGGCGHTWQDAKPAPAPTTNGATGTTLNPAVAFKLFIDKTVETEGGLWGSSAAVAREAVIDCAARAVKLTPDQLRERRDAQTFNAAMDAVNAQTKALAEAAQVFG